MSYSLSYSSVIFTAKEKPEFILSSNMNLQSKKFPVQPLKHCKVNSYLIFFFFSILKLETWPWESHSATAGREALLGDICHQPLLSSKIHFLAARCALNKQTKQGKSLPSILQQQLEPEVNLKEFDLFFQPLLHQKNSHQYHVSWALHRLVGIAMWKMSGSNSGLIVVWSTCSGRILGGTLI